MMKPTISLILVLLLSSSYAPQTATAFSLFPFPFSLPFSLPSILGGILGNVNAGNNDSGDDSGNDSSNDELARMCFADMGDGEACIAEIFGSFFNRAITVGPECCKAIIEIDEDCRQAVFIPFKNSYFTSSVKQFCNYINN